MSELELPAPSLVLVLGCEGSGAGAFAERLFGPLALRARTLRALVSGDPSGPREAARDSRAALEEVALPRARRPLATPFALEVEPWADYELEAFAAIAKRSSLPCHVLELTASPRACRARRPDLDVEETCAQRRVLDKALGALRKRKGVGFSQVPRPEAVEAWRGVPLPCDRRHERGPFDLIGDVHGCFEELLELLERLGYDARSGAHPEGRRLVFLGDLTDRGPRSLDALRLALDLVQSGRALAVRGNHDDKLARYLAGRKVKVGHGLETTVRELEALPPAESAALRARAEAFLSALPSHLVLEGGRLVAVHGGIREDLIGRVGGRVDAFALYGAPTGEVDAEGYPVRGDWAEDYAGEAFVVYGHTPVGVPRWRRRTICIDQGCPFGGALSALRWPERELVSVPARATHSPPRRGFRPPLLAPSASEPPPDWP